MANWCIVSVELVVPHNTNVESKGLNTTLPEFSLDFPPRYLTVCKIFALERTISNISEFVVFVV